MEFKRRELGVFLGWNNERRYLRDVDEAANIMRYNISSCFKKIAKRIHGRVVHCRIHNVGGGMNMSKR